MDARSKRREATRRQLEQQLKERQAREARRKRTTLVVSIVGTLVVIAVVVTLVVTLSGGSTKKPQAGSSDAVSPSATASTSASASASAPAVAVPTAACSTAPKAATTASFDGLTITGISDLKKSPVVSGKASGGALSTVRCEDLVVGTGKAASTSSTATVEYIGLVLSTGKVFQTSWTASAASFSLAEGQVITGFSQGIAGAGKVAPMRVGGRRIILMPAAAAYGASPPSDSGIPANADLAFVVDLQKLA